MTTFLLIRHALCDPVGRSIAGRTPGIRLNAEGREQARKLAQKLGELRLSAVYSSPLERALETAHAIAAVQRLPVETREGLNEIDFGEWTGRTIEELETVPQWKWFNQVRTGNRIPEGEMMVEVVARAVGELEKLRSRHPKEDELVAVVSHTDVLRAVLASSLGMSLDSMLRLELAPASVSILELRDYGTRVTMVNGMSGWPSGCHPVRPRE